MKMQLSAPEMVGRLVGFLIFAVVLTFILAIPLFWLWNWLMPEIFGLRQISWAQAWGLMWLSAVLLGPLKGSVRGS